jgi:hypothetical protein
MLQCSTSIRLHTGQRCICGLHAAIVFHYMSRSGPPVCAAALTCLAVHRTVQWHQLHKHICEQQPASMLASTAEPYWPTTP